MKLAAGQWRNGTWVRTVASCAARSFTRTGRDQHCEGSTNPTSAAEARERPGQAAMTAPRGAASPKSRNALIRDARRRNPQGRTEPPAWVPRGSGNAAAGWSERRLLPDGTARPTCAEGNASARRDLTSEAPASNCPPRRAAGGNRPGPVMRRRPAMMRGSGAEASAATGDRDAGEPTHEGRKVASPASAADPIAGKANTLAIARRTASPEMAANSHERPGTGQARETRPSPPALPSPPE